MTLLLDARRRAMLAEMGLRVWGQDSAAAAPAASIGATAPASAARVGARPPPPLAGAASAAAAGADGDAAPVAAPLASTGRVAAPSAAPVGTNAGTAERPRSWQTLREEVTGCTACGLCEGRRNVVLATPPATADWLVVGEAPGESEDLVGTPFAGQDGLLLANMLRAVGLGRGQHAYLTHALKCRPPANRSPEPEELARCAGHLRREVELLRPRVILALGRLAVLALLPGSEPLGKLRGRVHAFQGVPVVVSYAPAYLLRNQPEKARAWADLCLAQGVAAGQHGA